MEQYRAELCAWCHAPLPPRAPGRAGLGHPRWYCSQACRQAAYRERRERTARLDAAFGSVELGVHVPPTDEQIALTILEARSAAAAFGRLGRAVRRELAWRCSEAGAAIARAIDEYFPGA